MYIVYVFFFEKKNVKNCGGAALHAHENIKNNLLKYMLIFECTLCLSFLEKKCEKRGLCCSSRSQKQSESKFLKNMLIFECLFFFEKNAKNCGWAALHAHENKVKNMLFKYMF